jgi:hypothetical protein
MSPPQEDPRATDPVERGRILADLLELSDAFPPVPHRPLDIPPFRELVGQPPA